jgi:ABC-type phosphate/phosphonate transport system ATPase subunit
MQNSHSENGARASDETPHLSIRGLGLQRNGKWLFRDVTWEIPRGKLVAIVGPSGVGKSSLLSCLSGMLQQTEGEITYCCNAGCFHSPGGYQERIGIIFQNLLLSANSSLIRNVLCGRLGRYPWFRTLFDFPKQDKQRAFEIISDLGLATSTQRRAGQLSGGEQQRTAIARALFQEPEILLADEPVSNLDAYFAGRVLGMLRTQAHEQRRTVLCVLHDAALVEHFADFALSLDANRATGWKLRQIHG